MSPHICAHRGRHITIPQDLSTLATALWGGPGHPAELATSGEAEEYYLAIPSLNRAAYLLPLALDRKARARLLHEYNTLRTPGSRVARRLLAMASRTGVAPRAVGEVLAVRVPRTPDGSLLELAARHLGRDPSHLAMSCGVRVRNGIPRPTVTIVDSAGIPVAFLKVATQDLHRSRLRNEHQIRTRIATRTTLGISTPAPLFFEEWGGRDVLGTAPLPRDVRRVNHRDAREILPMLEGLRSAFTRAEHHLDRSPWLAGLMERAAALPDNLAEEISSVVDRLLERHGSEPIPHGFAHGDWSAWNMARTRTGDLTVWDWEFGLEHAPVGLDECNWSFAFATSVRGRSAASAARDLAASGMARRTRELFLLNMLVRRSEEAASGDTDSGAAASELTDYLRD